MQSRSIKKIVFLNSVVTLLSQLIQVLLGFTIRKFFIDSLGAVYLGYNSVFSNILQMLNLADLGIGIAITSFLYKPLVDKSEDRINALMYIYSRTYHLMGFLVSIAGMAMLLLLPKIIPDAQCSNTYLRILFIINLAGTISTYFLAYKRTLLIAQQQAYLVTTIDTIFYLICSIAQIIILLFWPNYIIFLVINVLKNILSNFVLMIVCNRRNKFLSNKKLNPQFVFEYKKSIFKYVKDLFISRISAYVYYSTDNIIISVYKGSLLAGYLSNYTMITNLVNNVIIQILSSLQATYGSFISSELSLSNQKQMTNNYAYANYIAGNFCMICIFFLIQPFITLYFGKKYILDNQIVFLLSVNFFLTIMIQIPSQVFVVYKLYHYDYPIVIISAILNIIISINLVQGMGISGVLIGTLVTSLLYLFSRYYIIARFVFNISYHKYIAKIIKYFMLTILSMFIAFKITSGYEANTWLLFIIKGSVVGITAICIPLTLSFRCEEFTFFISKFFPSKCKNCRSLRLFVFIAATVAFICTLLGKNLYIAGYIAEKGNKSLVRTEVYDKEKNTINYDKYIHISIDDTIDLFEDISSNDYLSIFENDTLGWMKGLHENHGAVFSCYVYYSKNDYNLSKCTDNYRSEFEENANWLRFGFHTINQQTDYAHSNAKDALKDYQKTTYELERIVGIKSIDNVIRLQGFAGNKDVVKALNSSEKPVIGLLTADDLRKSYDLDDKSNSYIYSHDEMYSQEYNMMFISTDLRVEFIDSVEQKLSEFEMACWNNQLMDLIVFTHEWELNETNKTKIQYIIEWGEKNGYVFEFPENVISKINSK